MSRSQRPYLVLILVLSAMSGCASRAVKTPTPAAHVRAEDLESEPTPPGVRYYSLIFGSQTKPKIAKYCHTWATVVRVTEGKDGQPPAIEPFTISWMPASRKVRLWDIHVKPGVNLDLHATIAEVKSHHEHISVWGPYEMRPGLFHKFLMQKEFMDSGQVGYQAIDTIGEAGRTGDGCDCIHAITDSDAMHGRGTYPLRRFGNQASQYIVGAVMKRGGYINPQQTHDWLLGELGIADCVKQRQYQCKRSLIHHSQ